MRTRYIYEHELSETPELMPSMPRPGSIAGLSGCEGCGRLGELSINHSTINFFDALKLVSAIYVLTGWRKGDAARMRTGAFLGTGVFGGEIVSKLLS